MTNVEDVDDGKQVGMSFPDPNLSLFGDDTERRKAYLYHQIRVIVIKLCAMISAVVGLEEILTVIL
jgi:hypothetical protein